MAKTHHAGLGIISTAQLHGQVTATGSGKKLQAANLRNVSGGAFAFTGTVTTAYVKVANYAIYSGTSGSCIGLRATPTGGSSTVSLSFVTAQSRIFLSPQHPVNAKKMRTTIMTQTGGSFKIGNFTATGVAISGNVHYVIIN